MPMNSGNDKNVAVRDEHGRWLKGFSGGPGRPAGSRNKLTANGDSDLFNVRFRLLRTQVRHSSRHIEEFLSECPILYR